LHENSIVLCTTLQDAQANPPGPGVSQWHHGGSSLSYLITTKPRPSGEGMEDSHTFEQFKRSRLMEPSTPEEGFDVEDDGGMAYY